MEERTLLRPGDEWKCVGMEFGAPLLMMAGENVTVLLHVTN